MEKLDWTLLDENMMTAISREWMLVTAGTPDDCNTMTASWGGTGFLWGKPVAFVFVRPERYTHEFIEKSDRLTLSFLGDAHRDVHKICGSKSGRDMDKIAAAGLSPVVLPDGGITFAQARLVMDCRKLYKAAVCPEGFVDKSLLDRWYNEQPGGGLHDMYVVEIEAIYRNA